VCGAGAAHAPRVVCGPDSGHAFNPWRTRRAVPSIMPLYEHLGFGVSRREESGSVGGIRLGVVIDSVAMGRERNE
jgi:hypothetical protein